MMRRYTAFLLGGLVLLALAIQLVPTAAADNPPVEEEVVAPDEIMAVLRRACYDCHSHETAWPWYADVAPASWLVRKDVKEGRRHLNFSTWNRYDLEDRAENWEEVAEEVGEGEMPLKVYLPLHGEARLTDADRQMLVDWARQRTEVRLGD
ncbi:MAG: heme-binding domain-containing protein [Gemmatimonadota bacterium]